MLRGLNPVRKLLQVLHFREIVGKNLGNILTKSAKIMYNHAKSCEELIRKLVKVNENKPKLMLTEV